MPFVAVSDTAAMLSANHYLGPCKRGAFAWSDEYGCIVLAAPASRNLPKNWLELSRWCIVEGRGSEQWAAFIKAWRKLDETASTIVSYSDPRAGHTGALYRACNWLWAPTWHRLRPPPSGNGAWSAKGPQSVKDRWVFPLTADADRAKVLSVKDDSVNRRLPWAEYREPVWSRGSFRPHTGGGNYKKFAAMQAAE
ncbi:MAG: hypothetical protein WC829_07035 [Hyphomicrobium sp.]|jgi:hypothetical protein